MRIGFLLAKWIDEMRYGPNGPPCAVVMDAVDRLESRLMVQIDEIVAGMEDKFADVLEGNIPPWFSPRENPSQQLVGMVVETRRWMKGHLASLEMSDFSKFAKPGP